MRNMRRFPVVGAFVVLMMVGFGASPGTAQSRAHVYLLRGLMNIFSLGMDTLAEEIRRQGIYATVHNYAEWQTLADRAAAAYRAGREGPIIIIGHSLGADAVMEMSAYLGRRGVPVALAIIAAVGKGGGTDSGKNAVTKPADPTQTPAKPTHGVVIDSTDPSMPQ
jgi:thioesterase domain-containing protein